MKFRDPHARRAFETYESSGDPVPDNPSREIGNGGMLPKANIGTAFAILVNNNSCAASPQHKPSKGRGGARNSASRTSDCITLAQAENLIAAAEHAWRIGLPLNRFITIHWAAAGLSDCEAAKATGKFLKHAYDYLAKLGHRTAWIWVRECKSDKGSHVHIALHVPEGETLGRMQMRWLRRIVENLLHYKKGQRVKRWLYRKGVIKTKPIGSSLRAALLEPEGYRRNLENVLTYVLKGASAEAATGVCLMRLEPQGRIIGRRVSTSQNIGKAARVGPKSETGGGSESSADGVLDTYSDIKTVQPRISHRGSIKPSRC